MNNENKNMNTNNQPTEYYQNADDLGARGTQPSQNANYASGGGNMNYPPQQPVSSEASADDDRAQKERYWAARKVSQRKKRIRVISIIFAVIAILCITGVRTCIVKPAAKYHKAVSYAKEGNYVEAYPIFMELGDYKDSQDKVKEIKLYYKNQALHVAHIGDVIWFGSYEQDGDRQNNTEDLEWIVLDKKGNKLLVLSKYGIDYRPNEKVGSEDQFDRVWANCYWRQWLNNDFYNQAFDSNEKEKIATVNIYPGSGIRPGDSGNGVAKQSAMTEDKIFLLDVDEIVAYFPNAKDRLCKPTEYAKQQGVQSDHPTDFQTMPAECFWWTRTNCNTGSRFFGVDYFGNIHGVNGGNCPAMRPAMWIEIS